MYYGEASFFYLPMIYYALWITIIKLHSDVLGNWGSIDSRATEAVPILLRFCVVQVFVRTTGDY